jgi:hypothetical protein
VDGPAVQQVFECRLASVGGIHVFGLFVQHAWLLALMKSADRFPDHVNALG